MTEEEEKKDFEDLVTLKEASQELRRSTKYLRALPTNILHKIRLVPLGHIRYLRSEIEQLKQQQAEEQDDDRGE